MRRGFTLVELLVAIIIIAVMAVISMPVASKRTRASREARLRQDLRSFRSAIERFHMDTGGWPTQLGHLERYNRPPTMYDDGKPPTIIPFPAGLTWRGPYLTNRSGCPIGSYDYTIDSPPTGPNVAQLHSDSVNIGSDGTAYNTW
jgi:general secretion pathway protein G